MQVDDAEAMDFAWNGLRKLGGVAALIAALLFRRNLAAEYLLLREMGITDYGPVTLPATVADWFTTLNDHPLVGLTLLNLFDVVNYALVDLIFLGLYAALRRVNRSSMALALALTLVGVAAYFASNQAFAMLSLSHQYAAATSDAQKEGLLAAGQALLAIHGSGADYGGGMYISFFCVSLAGLLIATAMRRGRVFGRATAYVGIIANGLALGYYLTLLFAPALIAVPLAASAPFLLVWYILIGRRLLRPVPVF